MRMCACAGLATSPNGAEDQFRVSFIKIPVTARPETGSVASTSANMKPLQIIIMHDRFL